MVGADLKNLVNEAALTAAGRGAADLSAADFDRAVEKIVLGAERRIAIPELERARTAYHEAGHALLSMLEPGADPLRKVSIVPRGQTLGSVIQIPERDRYGLDDAYLRGRITVALGGRAAEELVYGDVTTGAEADLEMVTKLARQMVGPLGHVAPGGSRLGAAELVRDLRRQPRLGCDLRGHEGARGQRGAAL